MLQLFLHFSVGTAPSAGMEMDIIVENICTVKEVRKKMFIYLLSETFIMCNYIYVSFLNVLFCDCNLQCLKSMLDAVGLDGKTTVFSVFSVVTVCNLLRFNFYALSVAVHQHYLCFCKTVIKQIVYCSTLVQYLVVNVI